MASSTRIAIGAVILLFQFTLHPPTFTSAQVIDNDSASAIADIHQRHSHLKPQDYGHGLLRANKRRHRTSSSVRRQRPDGPRTNSNRKKPAKNNINKKKKNNNKKKKNNNKKKNKPNTKPNNRPKNNTKPDKNKLSNSATQILSHLSSLSITINKQLFLYETPLGEWLPSTVYNADGLLKGLEVMNSQGVADMYYYLGSSSASEFSASSHKVSFQYGVVNVAAFLAQSMKETIKYNACDENNWDLINGGYPVSNSCGQLGQSYQDYVCPKGEEHMACDVDPNMEIVAVTHATWYGAPAPLFCKPKKGKNDFTGKWNYGKECNVAWADPPLSCDDYVGQKAGGFENNKPFESRAGRTDVEGCCWWGRGVIQTTGICNFGKLNYYLGARAAKEGRSTPYKEIDFCKDPEAICTSTKYPELKWIAGMLYWMESVQKYDDSGWNYMDKLHEFVDTGMVDTKGFIDSVSGIVNRGCHNPPCGTGALDGGPERHDNFVKVLRAFQLIE